MATLDQILSLLTGEKRWQGNQWRVYDALGAELADPGGVLWRGAHGALLWPNHETQIDEEDAPGYWGNRPRRRRTDEYARARYDEVAAVALGIV